MVTYKKCTFLYVIIGCIILTFLWRRNGEKKDDLLPIFQPIIPADPITFTFTIKSGSANYKTRLPMIIDTWFQLAPKDIFVVSDEFDAEVNKSLHGNLVTTNCGKGHAKKDLNCKLEKEVRVMIERNASWSCRFDDDNYVNIPLLMNILSNFDSNIPYYMGRMSKAYESGSKYFWFATGGGGTCLSRATLKLLKPKLHKDILTNYGFTEDVALADIITQKLGIKLTVMFNFYSHYNRLDLIPISQLKNSAVLSGRADNGNLVALPHFYLPKYDPLKFYTLHCFLFPHQCTKKFKRLLVDVYDPTIDEE